tara:strand:+ start:428 stop:688 length:261 start_codon:yes stop_codon:yes gene_type:complete
MEYSNADATHELTLLIETRIIDGVSELDIQKELRWCCEDAFDTAIHKLLPSVLEKFKRNAADPASTRLIIGNWGGITAEGDLENFA